MFTENLVANPGRLRILTALAVEEKADFVPLRQQTNLTDGNLASHARRLASAGLISIEKSFRNGKPITSLTLTRQGRSALESHARRVLAAISHRRVILPDVQNTPEPMMEPVAVASADVGTEDVWVD